MLRVGSSNSPAILSLDPNRRRTDMSPTWLLTLCLVTSRLNFKRRQCVYRLDTERRESVWLKDLRKVRGYDLDRVLIVDDEPVRLARNYGNAVYVTPFEGNPNDLERSLLLSYLENLRHTADFRTIEKRAWRSQVMTRAVEQVTR